MPSMRAAYEQDPATVLAANGIPSDVDSTQRELFEDRLRSVEPLATFALTNSLAGVLAPWLVAVLAVALANLWQPGQRMSLIALMIAAVILAACLTLTKSRTAVLAVAAGLVLIALHGHRQRWRVDWRISAAAAGAVAIMAAMAIYFRGLDVQVLSEAPKAVLYRLEYWQATARIIRDYPLFGCGPGNFQEVYAAYKLPQASETVADPHNIFLELWATAGTPAVLLLLGLMVAFVVDVAVAVHSRAVLSEQPPPSQQPLNRGQLVAADRHVHSAERVDHFEYQRSRRRNASPSVERRWDSSLAGRCGRAGLSAVNHQPGTRPCPLCGCSVFHCWRRCGGRSTPGWCAANCRWQQPSSRRSCCSLICWRLSHSFSGGDVYVFGACAGLVDDRGSCPLSQSQPPRQCRLVAATLRYQRALRPFSSRIGSRGARLYVHRLLPRAQQSPSGSKMARIASGGSISDEVCRPSSPRRRPIVSRPSHGSCWPTCGWRSGRRPATRRIGRRSSRRPTCIAGSIHGITWPGTPAAIGF